EQAAADIDLTCYLMGSCQDERFLISHLVRIVMLNYALQPIYEGLAEHKWSDAQLEKFDAGLTKIDFLADFRRSMKCEAAATAKEIDYIRRTRKISNYVDLFGSENPWS